MSDWSTFKVSEICKIKVSGVDKKIYKNEIPVKLCNYMDAYRNDYLTNKITYSFGSVTQSEFTRFSLKKGNLIITKDSETPEDIAVPSVVMENLENVVCGYHLAVLEPYDMIDSVYLMHCFNLPSNQKKFYKIASGSTRYGLTIGGIENVELTLPPLPQQQKIAKILSTCDEVIHKTELAIAKYEAIKQGMMKDLFTRGIDTTTGKLRPPYEQQPELYKQSELGWIPKEWEVKELEDISVKIGDGIHSTPKYVLNSEYSFVNGNNLNNGKLVLNKNTKFVDKSEFRKHRKDIPKNTILYSINGTIGNIAFYKNEKVVFGKSVAYISLKSQVLHKFIFYFLQSDYINKYFDLSLTGSTIKNLSLEAIRNTPTILPNNIEVSLIDKQFSAIDFQIQSETTTLTKYQQIKAGLMQDLLTGKVAVTI